MNPIEQAELSRLKRELARLRVVRSCAEALIDDVRKRYPNENFKCPFMKALDDAIKNTR
jgi:hypothetical protein